MGVEGWYRDLYGTQHGKDASKKEVEKLSTELLTLKEELAKLANDNSQLRGDTIKNFKLGHARRSHMIPLAASPTVLANLARTTNKVKALGMNDENEPPPPPLDITRARTTLD